MLLSAFFFLLSTHILTVFYNTISLKKNIIFITVKSPEFTPIQSCGENASSKLFRF